MSSDIKNIYPFRQPVMPAPGEIWQHRKGGEYVVMCIARDEEDPSSLRVIYYAPDKTPWTRKLGEWQQIVDRPDGPERFVRVEGPPPSTTYKGDSTLVPWIGTSAEHDLHGRFDSSTLDRMTDNRMTEARDHFASKCEAQEARIEELLEEVAEAELKYLAMAEGHEKRKDHLEAVVADHKLLTAVGGIKAAYIERLEDTNARLEKEAFAARDNAMKEQRLREQAESFAARCEKAAIDNRDDCAHIAAKLEHAEDSIRQLLSIARVKVGTEAAMAVGAEGRATETVYGPFEFATKEELAAGTDVDLARSKAMPTKAPAVAYEPLFKDEPEPEPEPVYRRGANWTPPADKTVSCFTATEASGEFCIGCCAHIGNHFHGTEYRCYLTLD